MAEATPLISARISTLGLIPQRHSMCVREERADDDGEADDALDHDAMRS